MKSTLAWFSDLISGSEVVVAFRRIAEDLMNGFLLIQLAFLSHASVLDSNCKLEERDLEFSVLEIKSLEQTNQIQH